MKEEKGIRHRGEGAYTYAARFLPPYNSAFATRVLLSTYVCVKGEKAWGRILKLFISVADPGCLSRISDPGSKNSNKRERWKKISCHTFLCSHKFHKIVNYFSFEVLKKKIWPNFQRIIELFTQKIVKKLLKIWSWDPGSGIRDPGSGIRKNPIPDPGSRGQKAPDPGSRIRIRNTAFYDPSHRFHGIDSLKGL